jgi:hypothetical protein
MAKAKRQPNDRQTKVPPRLPPGEHPLDGPQTKVPSGWRRSSKFPDYYEVDDLPKPEVKQTTHFPELLALANLATHKFQEHVDANGDVRLALPVLRKWFQEQKLSNGERVSFRLATMLATIIRGVEARKGGRPPGQTKTVKP